MRAEIARRLAEHAFERAIELSERLKPNVVCDLANAQVGIEQAGPRIFHAYTRDVIGELQAGGFVENFAEMKDARSRRLRHISQRTLVGPVLVDVLTRFEHERRFSI